MMYMEGSPCGGDPVPEPKVYILVRRDLPWAVRTVQAAHAVMQLVHDQPISDWGRYGPTVVLLGVEDESELARWSDVLGARGVGFREPDMWDTLTAVAYYGLAMPALAGLRLM